MDVDAPDKIKLPKDKRVLLFGGAAAVAVVYWWWHRAPTTTADAAVTPSTGSAERVPGPGADGGDSKPDPPDNKPVDDAAWAQLVITTMTALGFEPSLISSVTGKWLDGETISSPKEISLAALILGRVGYPPSGLHPKLGGTVPDPNPKPDPKPDPTWHGPLVRKTPGAANIPVKVPVRSVWLWWVLREYNNVPPDAARRKAAAKKLQDANRGRGKAYQYDVLNPGMILTIPAAIYV